MRASIADVRARVSLIAVLLTGATLLAQSTTSRPSTPVPAPPGPGAAAPAATARSPRNANYQIDATLRPDTHTIDGRAVITWTNITRQPTSELRFHLYWNAWRDGRSSWMRESRLGRGPMPARAAADHGAIDITALSLGASGADLLAHASFIAPDDGNPDDRTVLSVPLPAAVPPGGSVTVNVKWTSHVPRTYARTGVIGQYYFIAQWFPKLGVLEDAGWNCHQFHANTEFFSDFGTYTVRLSVPTGWPVGATGVETPGADGHTFTATDVHDFAWTTSPDFIEHVEMFGEPGLPKVRLRLLLQPEHDDDDQVMRHFRAARASLRNYGRWFGAYPYEQLTIVDPVTIFNPTVQGASTGGMEYPMLVTAGTRWKTVRKGEQPDAVTIHEVGHQFWYGMVATNEFEHAWMDEGLNTFSTARVIAEEQLGPFVTVERYFGGLVPWPYRDTQWTREFTGDRLDGYRAAARADLPNTPTWQYWPGTAGAITYNKTALWLHTLEKLLGWDTTQKILQTHFARGAFAHPTPEQFFAIANEVSGRDLTWFFDAVYRSNATFDYAMGPVSTRKTPAGVESTVVVRRNADGVFPIDIKITFADKTTRMEHWDGRAPWRLFSYTAPSAVQQVEIDPDHVLLLDLNVTNNSWTSSPQTGLAVKRWMLRWTTWAEEVLLSYAFFS